VVVPETAVVAEAKAAPKAIATPRRALLLCADDYGLSPGIDAAIAGLVQAGRLGAFSCLSNGPAWSRDAAAVAGLRSQAQAGLHFNLTEGRPLSPALARLWPKLLPLPRLLVDAHLGRLPLAAVADELAAQWQAFVAASGVAPDFIDGHQHVHHLPGVRDLLLDWLQRQPQPTPVRSTARLAGPAGAIKRWVIEHSGGRALARTLDRQVQPHRLPYNRLLLGAYDFVAADYGALMRAWLAQVPEQGALLFCHPGRPSGSAAGGDGDAPDPIAAARQRELAYLAGPDFPRDLRAAAVVLAPIW
jgi:predicted glycoside hydrolase/deacetylase ChbG (UPF0249 family)